MVNLAGFAIIVEMDNYVGKFFILYLETFHEEITSDEEFLKFESNKENRVTAFVFCASYFVIGPLAIIVSLIVQYQKCLNIDEYIQVASI